MVFVMGSPGVLCFHVSTLQLQCNAKHMLQFMDSMCLWVLCVSSRHVFCCSNDQNFDAFVQVLNETSGIEGGCIAIAVGFPGESITISFIVKAIETMFLQLGTNLQMDEN